MREERQFLTRESRRPDVNLVDRRYKSGVNVIKYVMMSALGLVWLEWLWGRYPSVWIMNQNYTQLANAVYMGVFGVMFAGGLAGVVINLFNYVDFGREGHRTDRHYTTEATMTPRAIRLQRTDDRQTLIMKYEFEQHEWLMLARRLSEFNWRLVREPLRLTGLFKNVTTVAGLEEVKQEFERVGIVEDGRINQDGRILICSYAGLDHLL